MQRDRKPAKNGLPFIVAFLSLFFIGWAHITTNLLGTKLDQSIKGASATDQYVVTYDHASRSYKLLVGSGGGGGGSSVVGFFAKSAGVTQPGTPTTIDVDEGLTLKITGVTARITPTYATVTNPVTGTASAGSANTFMRGDAALTIGAGVVTDTMVAAANKDGAAGTAGMRTIGTGAAQAASGADLRFPPGVSGAGKIIYDNGSAYVALAAGTSSQLLRGGSAPTWGAAPIAALQEIIASSDLTDFSSAKTGTGNSVVSNVGATIGSPTMSNFVNFTDFGPGGGGALGRLARDGSSLTWYDTAERTIVLNNDAALTNKRAPTITSETNHDLMKFNGTNWVRLAADTDGKVLTMVAGDPAWATAAAGGSGTTLNVTINNGSTFSTTITQLRINQGTNVTVSGGFSGTTQDVTVSIPAYGSSASTITQGNDTRLPPAPSGAGKMLYDNASAYVALAAGTSSQILVGGAVPAFGNAPLAAITEVLALPNLTDVTGKTGSGTIVVMDTSPTITTPDIKGFVLWDSGATQGTTFTGIGNGQFQLGGSTNKITETVSAANTLDFDHGALKFDSVTPSSASVLTLNTPTFVFGSDAQYDLMMRGASNYARLGKGSNSTVLSVSSGGVVGYATVTSAMITDGTITDTDVASANKDGATGTASMRTLGTGSSQAFPGNGAIDTLGAATDITTLNSSTSAHGLLKKLDNTATHYMDGTGAWSTPAATPKFLLSLMPGACEIVGNAADPLLVGFKSSTAGNASWSYLTYNDTTAQFGRWVIGPASIKNYAGGNLTIHIWWYATATTGGVTWTAKLLSRSAGQVMDAAYDTSTAHKVDTAPAGTTLQLVDDTISIASGDSGEIIANKPFLVQIERTVGDAHDNMSGDANLVAVSVTED